ncbi:MAG: preprotein translocase subunit YajC [Candidatus Omnitrophica bacterium 4484_49]|nr:preprotein translocase subunit YajC [Candidatus Omnitrophota bacterium]OQX83801.1 MAG: preprotein translocase subunit YajC [Candidatus Omnitrophica bacterium 4484_49]
MILAQIQTQPQPNPLAAFLPLIIIFGVFYFLLIRPQQKKQKEHQKMLDSLKRNDRVVTIGGIHGVIQDIKKDTVVLKIDDETKVMVDKSAIARKKEE